MGIGAIVIDSGAITIFWCNSFSGAIMNHFGAINLEFHMNRLIDFN